MKSLFLIPVLIFFFTLTSSAQTEIVNCSKMLNEFDVLIDTLERITKTYYENPNDRKHRETENFIKNKNEMNDWYKRWYACDCKNDSESQKRFETLEDRKRIIIKERYGL